MAAYEITELDGIEVIVFAESPEEAHRIHTQTMRKVTGEVREIGNMTLLDPKDQYQLRWSGDFDPEPHDEYADAVISRTRMTLKDWEACLGSGMFALQDDVSGSLQRFAWKTSRNLILEGLKVKEAESLAN